MTQNCENQLKFCKIKCHECDFVGREEMCNFHKVDCGGDNIPSFKQWIQIYDSLSKKRCEKTGMLEKESRRHVISALNEFKRVMNFSDDDKVSVITRKSLSIFCDKIGGKNISKKSKCQKIGQAFARWVRNETEDNWLVPRFDIPEIVDDSPRFREPSAKVLVDIQNLYRSLYGQGKGRKKNRDRMYAMFMYRYAMRNSDVDLLKWSNFETKDGRVRLVYTPHKTRLSSKRIVKIWMDSLDVYDLKEFRANQKNNGDDDYVFGGSQNLSLRDRLNKMIKKIGANDNKGLYLLRKICIHSTFKLSGCEAASAISGDDFETIKYHYADPDALDVSTPAVNVI